MENTVKNRLQSIQLGDPQIYKNIAILPLIASEDGAFQYRTLGDLLTSALELAQLEAIFRQGGIFSDDSSFEHLGQFDPLDLKDLRNLLEIVNPEQFRAAHVCLLNPTFGSASELVGGADCDLVIDDNLIEIKTVKNASLQRAYWDQLLGYFLLSKIGEIDGAPAGHAINRLSIYFSRFGFLWTLDIAHALGNDKLVHLVTWFSERAEAQ